LARLADARSATESALAEAEARYRVTAEERSDAERALRRAVDAVGEARSRLAQSAAHAARLTALEGERTRAEEAHAATVAALADRERELVAAEEAFREAERLRREAE